MWDFEVVNVSKAQPPVSDRKGKWYRYTIANRVTEITGTRRGTKEEVQSFVSNSIQRLNNRHNGPSFSNA
jgi:hypothetical protein